MEAIRPCSTPRSLRNLASAALLAACLAGPALLFAGCAREQQAEAAPSAAHRAPAAAPQPVRPEGIDGERAMQDLRAQVEFGPRVPGSPAHTRCRDWLAQQLRAAGAQVTLQQWEERLTGRPVKMSNIIGRWKAGSGGTGALLCAHWDTRPTADYEFAPAARGMPIPGANDGASGVAVLLEVTRYLRKNPPSAPVMIVFFDGEDYGPGVDRMFLGSRYFARNLPPGTPERGVLLDMVGDRDLVIPREQISFQRARAVQDEIYAAAARLGHQTVFVDRAGAPVQDDHVPLLDAGLQVADLIDFNYGPNNSWWHTLADTPDKCSPASLKAVAETVAAWLEMPRPAK